MLMDLQRQYAYDQLIERLYRIDDKWVVKGATALLARRISVRHTIDIDLYRTGVINEVNAWCGKLPPSTLVIGCNSRWGPQCGSRHLGLKVSARVYGPS